MKVPESLKSRIDMKSKIKHILALALIAGQTPHAFAQVEVTLPCTEGITSKNRATLARVDKIEIDVKGQRAFIFGKRFLLANPATANASIEKRQSGVLVLPLNPTASDAAIAQECLNLAKSALAKSVGFGIAAAADPGVIVGPASIFGHPELSDSHCMAFGGKYLASPSVNAWAQELVLSPHSCAILTTGTQVMSGSGSGPAPSGTQ